MKKKYLDFSLSALVLRLLGHIRFFLAFFRRRNKCVWLVGENRGEPLGDNGFWFYYYCRNIIGSEDVYLVVGEDSSLLKDIGSDRNVIVYGSMEHALVFHSASVFFYTHTFRDLAPIELFWMYGYGRYKVFLHHGVLGFKKFNRKYMKNKNMMDLFTLGGRAEFEIAEQYIGIERSRLCLTGYARYDNLFSKDCLGAETKIISYMPTHRNYLDGSLHDSKLVECIEKFIFSAEMLNLLEKFNCKLYFFPHKDMCHEFRFVNGAADRVKFISHGEESVVNVLKKSALLITDYSSVAWDFRYLGKPVIFFQPDKSSYLKDRGSYIDVVDSGLGKVCENYDDVIKEVMRLARCDFCPDMIGAEVFGLPQEYGFKGGACERIYKIVMERRL